MRLKRLTLHGYKTFASKTAFDFEGRITAIVGPNGSGKSNIADAIRWVLGEQSYSTLRGKRTADMIFAGSQQRPRAGMAQAILTLDNSEGWLPIDYSEIEIGRRAYRSGENEYLLNGQKVRLRDVFELLAESGLGQRTYTIIGQGLIDQALSLRADERRMLFEEAAGVSHYKVKRAETIRRLQETNHNLERVQDILAEIRPRLNSLRQKASRAQNYSQVAADLHHHLRIWYGYQWERTRHELRRSRLTSYEAQRAWEGGRAAQLAAQERVDEIRRQVSQLERAVEEGEQIKNGLRDDLEQARRDVAVYQERLGLWRAQLEENVVELPSLESQQNEARKSLDEALLDLQAAQEELDQQEISIEKFESSFQAQKSVHLTDRQTLKALEDRYQTIQTDLAQATGRLEQLQQQKAEKLRALQDESNLNRIQAEINRLEKVEEQAKSALSATQIELSSKREERNQIEKGLERILEEGESWQLESSKKRERLAEAETRQKLLSQFLGKDEIPPGDLHLLGRLFEYIAVPEEYTVAAETVLGSRATTWLVAEKDELWALIDGLTGQRVFAAALNSINTIPGNELPEDGEVIGWLNDLIDVKADARKIADLILGQALVVKNRDAAFRLAGLLPSGSMTVTIDGIVVHAGGLVESKEADPDTGILVQQEAWKRSRDEVEQLNGDLATLQEEHKKLQRLIDEKKATLTRLDNGIRDLIDQESKEKQNLLESRAALDLINHQLRTTERRKKEILAEFSKLEDVINRTGQHIEQAREELVKIDSELKLARERVSDNLVTENEEKRRRLVQRLESIKTIVAGRMAVVDSRRATLNQIDGQLRQRKKRMQELKDQIQDLEMDVLHDRLGSLQAQMDGLDKELIPVRQDLSVQRSELNRQENILANTHKASHDLEGHYAQARIEHSQRQNQLDNLKERIQADLGIVALEYDQEETTQSPLPLAEIVEKLPTIRELPDGIYETIQRYRGQLNRMGIVDPEAPAEYEETTQRYDFLSQQVEDLYRTQNQLRKVIDDLDDMTSRAFAATVAKTDAIFGDIFKRLFGGGAAQLVLTEPDDLTVSGVDIVARLPRRREQGLALLSGGERSLTATALIFALLKVSPTPFCVLDEVDAMLDEANVTRFRDQLFELSEQTQFIIITHNRGTVQVAESVYGVSMGQDSASQVISIRPEDFVSKGRHR